MSKERLIPTVCLLAAMPFTATGTAQEAARPQAVEVLHVGPDVAVDDAKLVVTASYSLRRDLADEAQYLSDLQALLADRKVAFVVLLPAALAAEVADGKPRFGVARGDFPADTPRLRFGTAIADAGSGQLDNADLLRDTIDLLTGARDGVQPNPDVLQSLIANVADGGEFDQLVETCLSTYPHSGRAHAGAVLDAFWCKGDVDGARERIDRGIEALANDAVPMTHFADLVLRGDRNDPAIARKLAMAMAPVAAGAADGAFTQLVYLRALLHAGQDRLAGRVAAKLPSLLGDNGTMQLMLAETVMDAGTPMVFRDLAERMVEQAERHGVPRQWLFGARHKILKRCGDDDDAEKLMTEYRKNGANSGLNNDAWYLMVQPQTLGRFDTLALAQCEQMMRTEGDGLDYNSKDTAALAHFVTGQVARAAELQGEVVRAGGTSSTYTARLKRYEATRDELTQRAAKKRADKR